MISSCSVTLVTKSKIESGCFCTDKQKASSSFVNGELAFFLCCGAFFVLRGALCCGGLSVTGLSPSFLLPLLSLSPLSPLSPLLPLKPLGALGSVGSVGSVGRRCLYLPNFTTFSKSPFCPHIPNLTKNKCPNVRHLLIFNSRKCE